MTLVARLLCATCSVGSFAVIVTIARQRQPKEAEIVGWHLIYSFLGVGLLSHIRFAALPLLQVIGFITLLIGGIWTWVAGLLFVVAGVVFDEISGDYEGAPATPRIWLLHGILFSVVPLTLCVSAAALLYTASPGSVVHGLAVQIGIPDHSSGWLSAVGAVWSAAMLIGGSVAFAHELSHLNNRAGWHCGQILVGQCLYTPIALEHIYGHHRNVGLSKDVATAPRGMTLWRYYVRALLGTYIGGAQIEARRLQRRQKHWLNFGNRFLQGLLLQLVILIIVYGIAGLGGLIGFIASGILAIGFIDASNYVAHYGLVRAPGQPIAARHSWNSARVLSTSLLINLQRHADHHDFADRAYWELRLIKDGPRYQYGMGRMAAIALIPPLWFRVVREPLANWDRNFASPEELSLLAKQNEASADERAPALAFND